MPKANTREKILETASRLFADKTFNGTTLNEIAKEVGIASSNLYHYFRDKEPILKEIIERCQKLEQEECPLIRFEKEFEKFGEDITKETLIRLVTEHAELYRNNVYMNRYRRIFQVECVVDPKRTIEIFGLEEGTLTKFLRIMLEDMVNSNRISWDTDIQLEKFMLSASLNILINQIAGSASSPNVNVTLEKRLQNIIEAFWIKNNIQTKPQELDMSENDIETIKEKFFEKALELFFKQGACKTTLEMIAKEINITTLIIKSIFFDEEEFHKELNEYCYKYLATLGAKVDKQLEKYGEYISIQPVIDTLIWSQECALKDVKYKYIFEYLCYMHRMGKVSANEIKEIFYERPVKYVVRLLEKLQKQGLIIKKADIRQYALILIEPNISNVIFYNNNIKSFDQIIETYKAHVKRTLQIISAEMQFSSEKDRLEHKNKILRYALKELAENGYSEATAANIAFRAHITKPLLYSYFDGHLDIIEELIQWITMYHSDYEKKLAETIIGLKKPTKKSFVKSIEKYVDEMMLDEVQIDIRNFLNRQYFQNDKVKKYYDEKTKTIRTFVIKVMEHFRKIGIIDPNADGDVLAFQFMMPITGLLFNINKNHAKEIKKKIVIHLGKFWDDNVLTEKASS